MVGEAPEPFEASALASEKTPGAAFFGDSAPAGPQERTEECKSPDADEEDPVANPLLSCIAEPCYKVAEIGLTIASKRKSHDEMGVFS